MDDPWVAIGFAVLFVLGYLCGFFQRDLANERPRVRRVWRTMTPEEKKAMDVVFEKMGETFKSMDEFFKTFK